MTLRSLISVLAVTLVAGCGGGDDAPPPPAVFSVTYEVTGTVPAFPPGQIPRATVTYRTPAGATQQSVVTLPASLPALSTYTAKEGDFLYVSAQKEQSAGNITVTIKVNGNAIGSASSDAAFGIATFSKPCC